jgi:hypothetical protein
VVKFCKSMVGAAFAALVAAPLALAEAGPLLSGYGGQGGEAQGTLSGTQGAAGALPFTGSELTLFVLCGVALLVTGLALRRFSGSRA